MFEHVFLTDLLHPHSTGTCWRHTAAPWKTWTQPSPPPRCCPHRIRRSRHSYRIQREERREYIYSAHQWNSPSTSEIPGNKDFGFSGISHVRLRAEFWVLQNRVYLTKEDVCTSKINENILITCQRWNLLVETVDYFSDCFIFLRFDKFLVTHMYPPQLALLRLKWGTMVTSASEEILQLTLSSCKLSCPWDGWHSPLLYTRPGRNEYSSSQHLKDMFLHFFRSPVCSWGQ